MVLLKRFTLLQLVIVLTFLNLNGQNTSVEKTVYSAQIGGFGIWGNAEYRINDKVALRSEIGIVAAYTQTSGNQSDVISGYNLNLEPRWYYNLIKRGKQNKRTANNTADYLSLKLSYITNDEVFTKLDFREIEEAFRIVTAWGMRRHIGPRINYELAVGPGISIESGANKKESFYFDVHTRIGYSF